MLNVDFMLWLQGIRELWPTTNIRVVTNGFYLNKIVGLYDYINSQKLTELWIGIHNKMHKEKIFITITK